jgi:phage tail-like protein
MNDDNRAYSGAIFALELDQDDEGGLFKSVEGGNIKADLIKYQNGAETPVFLRSGKPKYEDIKVQVGMSMSKPFYNWITSFCAGIDDRRTGAIVAADFKFKERARREFAEAIITEVGFPKLDGGDKNACFMSVTISPETVVYKPGQGTSKIANQKAKYTQKMWSAANFDFKIDGFAESCKQVTKVDAFTIKMKPIEYQNGGQRETTKVMGRIEYPNLVFYLPESDAQPFIDYHAKINLQGELEDEERLHGEINTYDNANGLLFTITFYGGEIFAITHDKNDATAEDIKMVKIELATEKIDFMYLKDELE